MKLEPALTESCPCCGSQAFTYDRVLWESRVLRFGCYCVSTVPKVADRLTRSRTSLQPSFHGSSTTADPALLVRTEYGCDGWKHVLLAGFVEARIVAFEHPTAHAMVGAR